jgi:DNA topoisomerase-2
MPNQSQKKDLTQKYKKLTDREHILQAPDTYIGSIEEDETVNWTFKNDKMKFKKYKWIPGLYKCFDEGIVNARDHYIRQMNSNAPVKLIDVTIDEETGLISIMNDGRGIDVAMHEEHNLWIPEMIFGHLRTSTNYDKNEKKIVGGKNGFGFKLVLIYSKWGQIETIDAERGLKYVQEFKNNLTEICKPKVTKNKSKPYTKVSFLPDYSRFGIENLTKHMFQLLKKRVYDIAAVTDKSVKVKFNNNLVPVRTFENYVNLYIGEKSESPRAYEEANERWEYAVCLTPHDEFTQVSFVNGIYTRQGGKHVEYILNQIVKKLTSYIEKKKKVKVKPATIKEQLMLFVNCVVENPSFDSQTKDFMNTAVSKFGSSCVVSDKFIDKLAKMGIMNTAVSLTEVKQTKEAKKTDGKKTKNIRGIPKLIDANFAGGAKSSECILILCEGDSAKSGIVSGLSKEDRNVIGIYPLKGKLMNVRDAAIKKISENNEINDIKKIIGLESNRKYTSDSAKKCLRYGKVMFMTDQDLDGSHIKGLGINLFQSQWHDLVEIDNFIGFMNTPILKATKGKLVKNFYYDDEYARWKKENDTHGWKIKYYKGLGTSTAKEFKEYFNEKRIVNFEYNGEVSDNSLDLVFNKDRADDRKEWLGNYNKENILNTNEESVRYEDFVNKEFIHFSKYDCERSIPNLMDGLKTSQRKILYAALKRNLTQEIKVAQFAGYVSEHSAYHHGEMSLNKAIVNMAQEFVGSNNINLLLPNGQFGTRLQGGKDSASERYIFTQLNQVVRDLYISHDANVLNYLDDDGTPVEPEFYVPIIPMILVNGTKGIGTGFSTEVLNYNPVDIIQYIVNKIKNVEELPTLTPYYDGFQGEVIQIEPQKYMFVGKYETIDTDVIRVSELPIGYWTQDFKNHLEFLMETTDKKGKKKQPLIKDYNDMSTDTNVDFTITFVNGKLDKLLSRGMADGRNQLEKQLNLFTTKTTSNIHLFDEEQRMCKFKDVESIIDHYMPIRLQYYQKRKDYMIKMLEREVMILHNKARFIEEQCEDKLDLRRKKKDQVSALLTERDYDKIDEDGDYKYLVSMPMSSVMEENIEKLRKERDEKKHELEVLREKSIQNMWLEELETLYSSYENMLNKRRIRMSGVKKTTKKMKATKKSK